jgi:hypothetical protein
MINFLYPRTAATSGTPGALVEMSALIDFP